jgi:hypothetical protein
MKSMPRLAMPDQREPTETVLSRISSDTVLTFSAPRP